jgi:DNA-directed RNA polymerase specialized sigma24 family protein
VTSDNPVTARTRSEVEAALSQFSLADSGRLRAVAKQYSFGRGMEWQDLLQEALCRSLASRNCPSGVDLVKFLCEAMRSIAHGEADKIRRRPVLVSVGTTNAKQEKVLNHPDSALDPEEKLIHDQTFARLRRDVLAAFDDDVIARDLVDGMMEGFNAGELRELANLDPTTYESKRRFIRRRLEKRFPKDGSHD